MKRNAAAILLLLGIVCGWAQPLKYQAFTTNSGPAVTNIILSLAGTTSGGITNNYSLGVNLKSNVTVGGVLAKSSRWMETQDDVDHLVLSGSDYTGVNGTYVITNGGSFWNFTAVLTNGPGGVIMAPDSDMLEYGYVLTNVSTHARLFGDQLPGTSWVSASGVTAGNVPPTSAFITNSFSVGATNAVLASASPNYLLQSPSLGETASQFAKGSFPGGNGMFYMGKHKAGVIRNFWLAGAFPSTFLPWTNLHLRIWCDGGDKVNGVISDDFLCVDASLASLLGRRHVISPGGPVIRDTRYLQAMEGGDWTYSFEFRLPIFFTNGCFINIVNATNNVAAVNGFWWTQYEAGPPPEYRDWRLRSYSSWNTNLANYQVDNIFFGVTNKPSAVVAFFLSGSGNSDGLWIEEYWKFNNWSGSGGEDAFLNPAYFSYGCNFGRDYGTVFRRTNIVTGKLEVSAYRYWSLENAMTFTNTVQGRHTKSINENYNTLVFYYSP